MAPRLHYEAPQQFSGDVVGPFNVGVEPGKKRGEQPHQKL